MLAGQLGHPSVGFDTQHLNAALHESNRNLARATSHIHTAGRPLCQQVVEQTIRVAGPVPLIALCDRPERLGPVPIAVKSV